MVTVDRQRHIVLDRTASFIGTISSALNAGVRSAEAYADFLVRPRPERHRHK